MLNQFKKKASSSTEFPSITVIVPCFNEALVIEEKINNCFELIYPKNKLHFIFITDGSTDETANLISKYPEIHLMHQSERNGKAAAENRAISQVTTEISLFCDANALFNKEALTEIVKHFNDPQVGGVSGEKRLHVSINDGAIEGEGIYWKYESFLKEQDAKFYSIVGAAGEIFAIRTLLYQPMPDDTINDDLTQSLLINLKGYRIGYANSAYAFERPSENVLEERKRKIRMIAGAWQSMVRLPQTFNVFKNFKLSFQFISHRVMRWTLCPLALLLAFVSNIFLVIQQPTPILLQILAILQIIFYIMAGLGFWFRNSKFKLRLFYFCYYFTFMHYCAVLGFLRFIQGKQKASWERSQRKS